MAGDTGRATPRRAPEVPGPACVRYLGGVRGWSYGRACALPKLTGVLDFVGRLGGRTQTRALFVTCCTSFKLSEWFRVDHNVTEADKCHCTTGYTLVARLPGCAFTGAKTKEGTQSGIAHEAAPPKRRLTAHAAGRKGQDFDVCRAFVAKSLTFSRHGKVPNTGAFAYSQPQQYVVRRWHTVPSVHTARPPVPTTSDTGVL